MSENPTKRGKGSVGEGESDKRDTVYSGRPSYSGHQPSDLSDLFGGSTCMDVDVESVEAELNDYTRV
jgi:hypothetical protein